MTSTKKLISLLSIIYQSPTLTNFYPILIEVYRMHVNCYGEKKSRKRELSSLLLQGGINPLNILPLPRKAWASQLVLSNRSALLLSVCDIGRVSANQREALAMWLWHVTISRVSVPILQPVSSPFLTSKENNIYNGQVHQPKIPTHHKSSKTNLKKAVMLFQHRFWPWKLLSLHIQGPEGNCPHEKHIFTHCGYSELPDQWHLWTHCYRSWPADVPQEALHPHPRRYPESSVSAVT